jgi:hypothetical protein
MSDYLLYGDFEIHKPTTIEEVSNTADDPEVGCMMKVVVACTPETHE